MGSTRMNETHHCRVSLSELQLAIALSFETNRALNCIFIMFSCIFLSFDDEDKQQANCFFAFIPAASAAFGQADGAPSRITAGRSDRAAHRIRSETRYLDGSLCQERKSSSSK